MTSAPPDAQLFRRGTVRLTATLTRRVGAQHLGAVEDAVQSALVAALESWPVRGRPTNPEGWLYRVAYNALADTLRSQAGRRRILERVDLTPEPSLPGATLAGELPDDQLRMLFVCCDDALPIPSQLALALKTLCGFGVREVACHLFTTEANVYKRLGRARAILRKRAALPELCTEALRLGRMLASHPVGSGPQTAALVALMFLHLARFGSRQDAAGDLHLRAGEGDRARAHREAALRLAPTEVVRDLLRRRLATGSPATP
ncbi:MAG: RNA polymerase sigma factor (sigma-70 family) [Myxococcota bacterium]